MLIKDELVITDDHISNGLTLHGSRCPTALALKNKFNATTAGVVGLRFSVVIDEKIIRGQCSLELYEVIKSYDEGNEFKTGKYEIFYEVD